MKRFLCFALMSWAGFSAWCQTSLFNNMGAGIYLMPGSYMIVNNDSLYNHIGTIQNAGDLRVAGDIYNDDTLTGGPVSATGLYDIGGNWVNSGTVVSYQDSVMLNGTTVTSLGGAAGSQWITGTQVTPFYDLVLAGTPGSVKTQNIDASVSGILDLRDHELATQANEMLVLNTSPAAITQANANTGSGYVSSLTTGKLTRATDQQTAYFYPTGIPSSIVSATDPFYYRPIDMTPASASVDRYGVRLADNPTTDGFNVLALDTILCSVNPHFYHLLYHSAGVDPAAITMYFDPGDGAWTDIGHWGSQAANVWNYTSPSTASTGYGFSSLQIANWSNFTPDPFALASKKFSVSVTPNQTVSTDQTVSLLATIGTTNIDSILWSPDLYLSNNTIADPVATATQTITYYVTVTDNAGCKVKDSVTITVQPGLLLIPTAFSPNNDGVNDLFRPLNKNLNKIDFQVYDRWGQKIFETDVIGDGWDGTYRNVKQDIGVYVWQAQYQLQGSTETISASGNVTLVR